HGEVHDNLLNLSDIRLYLAQPRIRREYEINVRSDESGQHLIKFAYNEIQVDDFWRHHLHSAEGQQLSRQGGGPLRSFLDLLDTPPMCLGRLLLASKQFCIAADHHQQIVKVMSDSSGQAPHSFHLL